MLLVEFIIFLVSYFTEVVRHVRRKSMYILLRSHLNTRRMKRKAFREKKHHISLSRPTIILVILLSDICLTLVKSKHDQDIEFRTDDQHFPTHATRQMEHMYHSLTSQGKLWWSGCLMLLLLALVMIFCATSCLIFEVTYHLCDFLAVTVVLDVNQYLLQIPSSQKCRKPVSCQDLSGPSTFPTAIRCRKSEFDNYTWPLQLAIGVYMTCTLSFLLDKCSYTGSDSSRLSALGLLDLTQLVLAILTFTYIQCVVEHKFPMVVESIIDSTSQWLLSVFIYFRNCRSVSIHVGLSVFSMVWLVINSLPFATNIQHKYCPLIEDMTATVLWFSLLSRSKFCSDRAPLAHLVVKLMTRAYFLFSTPTVLPHHLQMLKEFMVVQSMLYHEMSSEDINKDATSETSESTLDESQHNMTAPDVSAETQISAPSDPVIDNSLFLHICGKVYTFHFENSTITVDYIYDFIDNDLGIPSSLFTLVSCGKVLKTNQTLTLPTTTNVHAMILGKGGNPSDECSGCHKVFQLTRLSNFATLTEACKTWLIDQRRHYYSDLFCAACYMRIVTEFRKKHGSVRGTKRSITPTSTDSTEHQTCSTCCGVLNRNSKKITKLDPALFSCATETLNHNDTELLCQKCFGQLEKKCRSEMASTSSTSVVDQSSDSGFPESHSSDESHNQCLFTTHSQLPSDCSEVHGDESIQLIKSSVQFNELAKLFPSELDADMPSPPEILVCPKHQNEIRKRKYPVVCCLCLGSTRWSGTPRPVTDYTLGVLDKFCRQNNVELDLHPFSVLCMSCRKLTLNYNVSTNLQPIEDKCLDELDRVDRKNEDNYIMVSSLQTSLRLIETFRQGKAVLLSEVLTWFSDSLFALRLSAIDSQEDTTTLTNTLTRQEQRLAQINIFLTLGDAMVTHTADNRKKSVMLYPSAQDLFDPYKALHETLSKDRNAGDCATENSKLQSKIKRLESELKECQNLSLIDKVKNMSKDLTTMITKQCEVVQKKFQNKRIQDLPQLTLDETIKMLDPIYWNFICLLTSNQQERSEFSRHHFDWSSHHNIDMSEGASDMSKRRMSRRTFLAFNLLFTKNEQTNGLMTLLSDKINKYSLSADLMNFFNKLGVCVSHTTYRRFVEKVSKKMKKDGPSKFLSPNTFTICTIDNIDKAMPCASVKSSDEKRPAMHATSMCFMQPAPQKFSTSSASNGTCTACSSDCSTGENESNTLCSKCQALSLDDILGKPRARSMAESGRSNKDNEPHIKVPPMIPRYTERKVLSLDDFQISTTEQSAINSFTTEQLTYALERTVYASEFTEEEKQQTLLPGLKCKLYLEHSGEQVEKSKVAYIPLLYKHADDIDTVDECLDIIHEHASQFQSPTEPLVVVGDAKTYEHVQSLKRKYGEQLDWVIPFVGDFHILMNTQSVLMKIFWDAGLKEFSQENFKTEFYQQKLKECSKFKTEHHFFLQIWEALYQYQIETFMKWRQNKSGNVDICSRVKECISCLDTQKTSNFSDVSDFLERQTNLETSILEFETEFNDFRRIMCEKDKTFKFWDGFVHTHVFSYIGLWLATRSGNWDLRLGCLKNLAPLFHAYDRPTYAKIVVQHLADVARMPQSLLDIFRNGGFVISLSGTPFASVALDEAHEMTINKDLKNSITVAYEDYVVAKSEYLPYRAILQLALDRMFMTTRKPVKQRDLSRSIIMTEERNVQQYKGKITQSKAFEMPVENSDHPVQLHTNIPANKQQDNDLTSFESIGKEYLESYINLFILKHPSDKIPVKRKNLKTFSKQRVTKTKQKQAAHSDKMKYFALKAQAAESSARNLPISKVGRLIELPRAIAQENKLPVKGQKSSATNFLAKRFNDKQVIVGKQNSVSPDVFVLEGMFMINTKPRQQCRTFGDYAEVLLRRWIVHRLSKHPEILYVVFDDPDRNGPSPKDIERTRRYGQNSSGNCKDIETINADTKIPKCSWTDFLSNRQNKRNLCNFLSHQWSKLLYELKILKPGQKFITSGGFTEPNLRDFAVCVTLDGIDETHFSGNHIEGDTKCWLHAHESKGKVVQIYSPDTDIYHIGLNLIDKLKQTIIVQINMPGAEFEKFINLNKLAEELILDHELHSAVNTLAPRYLHIVYVCSGCDYVSYFTKLGKPTFYRIAFKYADFIWNGKINHNESVPGSFESMPEAQCQSCNQMAKTDLCTTCMEKIRDSACAFFRLVGAVYYNKYSSSFSAYDSVGHHFSEVTGPLQTDVGYSTYQLHCAWLDDIREQIWQRFVYEDEVMPSNDALFLHWQRCVWVLMYYSQALNYTLATPDLMKYGWEVDENGLLCIKWDLPENMDNVRQFVKVLETVCHCKTSGCAKAKPNKHCKCFRQPGKTGCSKLCGCGGKCSFPEVVNGNVSTNDTDTSHPADDAHMENRESNQSDNYSDLDVSDLSDSELDKSDDGGFSAHDSDSDFYYHLQLDSDIDDFYFYSDIQTGYGNEATQYQCTLHQEMLEVESESDDQL